mmetsp:Transcript_29280/g.48394  ORF Transcript_29280/g.48394 Transcript_29280/m.48394 type:complete len:304 (+) Transcript_29280:72-983(+)|eukprot:CAMPEP_0119015468 /NCGR_PEP_ID=MMETSP1176-20130426/11082_1 /TAXON_ID=265551 /ORGANISM="Synedropsis recta cf, Strain CCMP1620" /LENGTH=303 /DNA_ID=CAMNT_0006968763 /DNA_START=62 /DNA_END=973 /DNA_ORIENTATION=+
MVETCVYTLLLENGFYYVGTTTKDVNKRFKEHQEQGGGQHHHQGSAWTRLHPPICVDHFYSYAGQWPRLEEDKQVCALMLTHGIDRIRGGSYSKCGMSDHDVDALTKKLWHAENACLRCGRKNHFAISCYAKIDSTGSPIKNSNSKISSNNGGESEHKDYTGKKRDANTTAASAYNTKRRRTDVVSMRGCARRGRGAHSESSCYATRTTDGDVIAEDDDDDQQDDEFESDDDDSCSAEDSGCARCGRDSHNENGCYATRTIEGDVIEDDDQQEEEFESSDGGDLVEDDHQQQGEYESDNSEDS